MKANSFKTISLYTTLLDPLIESGEPYVAKAATNPKEPEVYSMPAHTNTC